MLVATWDSPRVSGKLASLRSRIRGGLTNCEVVIVPAAQFLTLRLVTSIATERICVDLDGPGHAPPYLCVSVPLMRRKVTITLASLIIILLSYIVVYEYIVIEKTRPVLDVKQYKIHKSEKTLDTWIISGSCEYRVERYHYGGWYYKTFIMDNMRYGYGISDWLFSSANRIDLLVSGNGAYKFMEFNALSTSDRDEDITRTILDEVRMVVIGDKNGR